MTEMWKVTYSSLSRAHGGERNCSVELVASSYEDLVQQVAELGNEIHEFRGSLWMEGHSSIDDLRRDADELAANHADVKKRALAKLSNVEKIALGIKEP